MKCHEKNAARWFADKVVSESRFCKELSKAINEIGFEPTTGSIIVELMITGPDRSRVPIKLRFRPELMK